MKDIQIIIRFFIFYVLILNTGDIIGQCTAGWCWSGPTLPSSTIFADPNVDSQDSPCYTTQNNGGATQNCYQIVFDASAFSADPCDVPQVTFTPWQGCGNGVGNFETSDGSCVCVSAAGGGTPVTVSLDPTTYIGTYIMCTPSNKMNLASIQFCRDFCWNGPPNNVTNNYDCPPGEGGAPMVPAIPADFVVGSGGDDESVTESTFGITIYDLHCTTIETEAVDSDNGGSGCFGDPFIVTRTYTLYSDGIVQGTWTESYVFEDKTGLCPSCIPTTCAEAAAVPATICDILTADPGNPLEALDCDMGGIDNATECSNSGDPSAASDECTAAIASGADICALIAADPTIGLATLDCDMGGVDNATECSDGRDPLFAGDDVVVPVKLKDFNIEVTASGIELIWITSSEVNNDMFIVEYSNNSVDFEEIGVVEGNENSNSEIKYSYNVKPLNCNIHFFRLKQVDFDGQIEYSKIMSADPNCNNSEMVIFNNPVIDNLYIQYNAQENQGLSLEILSIDGYKVRSFVSKVDKGNNSIEFNISELPNGVYILNIITDLGKQFAKKLIKHD